MPATIRFGVYFKSATRSAPVENFLRRVGVTRLDTSDGPQKNKQTFWFKDEAHYNKEIPGIIESINAWTVHHPIPVFQVVEAEVSEEKPQGSSVQSERPAHNREAISANLIPATSTPEEAPAEEVGAPEPEPQDEPAPAKNKGGRPRKHK